MKNGPGKGGTTELLLLRQRNEREEETEPLRNGGQNCVELRTVEYSGMYSSTYLHGGRTAGRAPAGARSLAW